MLRSRYIAFALLIVLSILGGGCGDDSSSSQNMGQTDKSGRMVMPGSAAMVGSDVPAPGGPHALDDLLYPPEPTAYDPGNLKKFELTVRDATIEVADGVKYNAWTYNGTVPGPTLRATEGDVVELTVRNETSHPHTAHLHGIHPANMDGVFETIAPGDSFTYKFTAKPGLLQLYHCHSAPLKKHIAKGLYGTFIIDPKTPPAPAKELVMLMNGFDTDGDGSNNFYSVNGKAFYYAKYPIKVQQGELVRIYLGNMTEFDLINSFHLHGNFFHYWPTGYGNPKQYTDMVTQAQGERGIIEVRFEYPGKFMFHSHQSEFADLGWMGFFDVHPATLVKP